MRTRSWGLAWGSIFAGCTRATTPDPLPPTEPPVAASAPEDDAGSSAEPAVSIVEIIGALEFVGAEGEDVWLDDGTAAEACDKAGYPETLDTEIARRLGPESVGAQLSIVHPQGVATPTVTAVHCHAPENEDDSGQAQLMLSPKVPKPDRVLGLVADSFLTAVGLRFDPKAGLRLPTPHPGVAADVLAVLLEVAKGESRQLPVCDEESGEPTPPLTVATLKEIKALPVAGRDGTSSLVTFEIERCEQISTFGVLLDPKGHEVTHWVTNNGVAALWITDLDGDGDEEIGLQQLWLEDGMQEISVEYRDEGVWGSRLMYFVESP